MNYSKIKVPFINNFIIKEKAEKFLKKHWDDILPVDIEKIIDVKLGIDIIPVLEMENRANTNALITSNWKAIYVDKNLFEDERRQSRLRFSLAHEIGHFILHKNIYDILKIKSVEEFYKFMQEIPNKQYNYLEIQANKFASHLLMPRDLLNNKFQKEIKNIENYVDSERIQNIDSQTLKSYIATPLAKEFGVSSQPLEIALGDIDYFKE